MSLFKITVIGALLSIYTLSANAQPDREMYFSVGISTGTLNYKGDLDDNLTIKFTKPGFGLSLDWHFVKHMSLSFNAFYGWMGADDKRNTDRSRFYRNLHFYSYLTEVSMDITYQILASHKGGAKHRSHWSPFIFAGGGIFNYNPTAKPEAIWVQRFPNLFTGVDEDVDLQPLGTEGQNLSGIYPDSGFSEPYKLTQVCIPFGIGFRRKLGPRWDIQFELGMRKTFTDYLDDVSGVDRISQNSERGTYADPLLLAQTGTKSALFSDRSGYTNFGENLTTEGVNGFKFQDNRGFKDQNDWYVYTNVTFSYVLIGGERCPKFK